MEYMRTILNCLANCFTCHEGTANQDQEPNERTHILVDPISSSGSAVHRMYSDDMLNDCASSLPRNHREQAALNRIVQDTVTNLIDVAAMDTHTLEPQEFNNRIKVYTQRLNQGWSKVNMQDPHCPLPCMLIDVPNPELLLSLDPISKADYDMIRQFAQDANAALNDIRVEHVENLVVPFEIPMQ